LSIYNTIEDFLIAKSHWESIPLKVTNEGLFEQIDGEWKSINQYPNKPVYHPQLKDNPDKKNIDCGIIPTT